MTTTCFAIHAADKPGRGLWTRNLPRAHRIARDLRAGMLWFNSDERVNPGSPFGGDGRTVHGREMGSRRCARTRN